MAATFRAEVNRDFLGRSCTFRLTIARLMELEKELGVTVTALLERLSVGRWSAADPGAVIRAGLVGGGMTRAEVGAFLGARIEESPLLEQAELAIEIMTAAFVAPPGKPTPPAETAPTEAGSTGPTITAAAG